MILTQKYMCLPWDHHQFLRTAGAPCGVAGEPPSPTSRLACSAMPRLEPPWPCPRRVPWHLRPRSMMIYASFFLAQYIYIYIIYNIIYIYIYIFIFCQSKRDWAIWGNYKIYQTGNQAHQPLMSDVNCGSSTRALRKGRCPDHGPKTGATNLEAGLLIELRLHSWVWNLTLYSAHVLPPMQAGSRTCP